MAQISPFLMFEGNAEEAMRFYVSLFPNSSIERVSRHPEDDPVHAGWVQYAIFMLNGQRFMCIDSPVKHGFSFTPAMSLHVTCATEAEIDALAAALGNGGQILMPLDKYPFSPRYTWLNDRFGVSWQLMLADA